MRERDGQPDTQGEAAQRKRSYSPSSKAFEILKTQKQDPEITDLKPAGTRLQCEPGKCQRSKAIEPDVQTAQTSNPWRTQLPCSQCSHTQGGHKAAPGPDVETAATRLGTVGHSELDCKAKAGSTDAPNPCRPQGKVSPARRAKIYAQISSGVPEVNKLWRRRG